MPQHRVGHRQSPEIYVLPAQRRRNAADDVGMTRVTRRLSFSAFIQATMARRTSGFEWPVEQA